LSRDKIKPLSMLARITAEAREAARTVVLAHGVFDVMHLGHIRHLQEARSCGDLLVVTLTADRHVNKGPGRPVFTARMRRWNSSIGSASTRSRPPPMCCAR
jgi:cytidyltransferase-like protein